MMNSMRNKKRRLKAYIAYSREEGPAEGAILVIAHTAKEARKLAFQSGDCLNVDDWLDQAARLIKSDWIMALADQDKLTDGQPHVIWGPVGCDNCHYWGEGITVDDKCCNCNEYPGDELINRLKN